jgi:hypothetical protein
MERLMLWMYFLTILDLFFYYFRVEFSRGQRCAATKKTIMELWV